MLLFDGWHGLCHGWSVIFTMSSQYLYLEQLLTIAIRDLMMPGVGIATIGSGDIDIWTDSALHTLHPEQDLFTVPL